MGLFTPTQIEYLFESERVEAGGDLRRSAATPTEGAENGIFLERRLERLDFRKKSARPRRGEAVVSGGSDTDMLARGKLRHYVADMRGTQIEDLYIGVRFL